jgi:predicted  nucleic acid-binding Zn-ribbon protein
LAKATKEERIKKFQKKLASLKLGDTPNAIIIERTGEHKGNVSDYVNGNKPPSRQFLQKFDKGFEKELKAIETEQAEAAEAEKRVMRGSTIPTFKEREETFGKENGSKKNDKDKEIEKWKEKYEQSKEEIRKLKGQVAKLEKEIEYFKNEVLVELISIRNQQQAATKPPSPGKKS